VRGILVSRGAGVAGAALLLAAAVGAFSEVANAQTTYCWIDAKTGETPQLGPPNWRGPILDPIQFYSGGHNYVKQPDGTWIDAKTGETPQLGPPNWRGPILDPKQFYSGGHNYVRVPCPPASQSSSTSWTGGFGGVQLVGSWSGVTTSEYLAATGVRTNQFDDTGSGFGGGVNFGWNWQPWNPSTVVGVVFDINGMNDKVQHDFAGGNYIGSIVNFTASAQVRGGVLVAPNFLLYGQGGLSIANQQLKIDFGGPETNESKIVPGLTLGFGGEWKLATNPLPFGRSMSLFAGYEHTWWDKARLDMPDASRFFNYTWQRETDAVKFGARINWGDGPPR
jgi:hypothetical protein